MARLRKDRLSVGECGICILVGCDLSFESIDVSSVLHDSIEVQGIKIRSACRDFNAHHSSWGCGKTDVVGRNLLDTLDRLNLVITNNRSPTLLTPPGSAVWIIDLAIASAYFVPFCTFLSLPDTAGSDHFPIAIGLGVDAPPKRRFLYKIKLGKSQKADLFARLSKESHLLECLEEDDEAATSYSRFIDLIKSHVSSVLPDRDISPRTKLVKKFKASPVWWDEDCQRAIESRAKAMHIFKQFSSINNLIAYKKACASCIKIISKAKRDKWRDLCSSFDGKTPTAKLWNFIKSFRNRNLVLTNDVSCPAQVIDQAIFNLCPDSCLDGNLPSLSQMKLQDANSPNVIISLNEDLSRMELDLALSSSRVSSAPGLDQIDYDLLNILTEEYRVKLLDIFNNIFKTGSSPEVWKSALVIFIPKSDGKGLRPISLLSCVFKLMEKIIYYRLRWARPILPDFQFGFRSSKSCADYLCTLTNYIPGVQV
ncbi:PREDICTED: RNA-directed DNA polymerase from mobile element jockey-like [Wasmannia auropunctata]|uniref:RNA-directed DNA polymerase from mobile element jockey-like n=1 Tax=Wasmannia auropunctata TaxID=64793 RepID=UPI0005EE5632|nr:PREDICTED: RNA-directed DNA polymerase from mobile element jockey-like [Wasmannia auropunctata]